MSLAGKAVLVTGTTSGLGRSIARVWAAQGARVIATGRRAELGESLEKEVRDAGGELSFLRLDVSSRDDCRQAVQAVLDSYGRLDILVNNAGIEGPIVDAHEMSEDDWDEVVGVNLNGAFYCSKHAIRAMKAQGGGGALLHIASINAIEALGHMVAYNTTKAGLVQLSRTPRGRVPVRRHPLQRSHPRRHAWRRDGNPHAGRAGQTAARRGLCPTAGGRPAGRARPARSRRSCRDARVVLQRPGAIAYRSDDRGRPGHDGGLHQFGDGAHVDCGSDGRTADAAAGCAGQWRICFRAGSAAADETERLLMTPVDRQPAFLGG